MLKICRIRKSYVLLEKVWKLCVLTIKCADEHIHMYIEVYSRVNLKNACILLMQISSPVLTKMHLQNNQHL